MASEEKTIAKPVTAILTILVPPMVTGLLRVGLFIRNLLACLVQRKWNAAL